MLVLTRHVDESILISDDIVITVLRIYGDKVRLGIACPIEISVHRQEVADAIRAGQDHPNARPISARRPAAQSQTHDRSALARDALDHSERPGISDLGDLPPEPTGRSGGAR